MSSPSLASLWEQMRASGACRTLSPQLRLQLRRNPSALCALYLGPPRPRPWQRTLLLTILREDLRETRRRAAALENIDAILAAEDDTSILSLQISADRTPLPRLRALVQQDRQTSLSRRAAFALVRAGDLRWLVTQLRAGTIPAKGRLALVEAAADDNRAARRLVAVAAALSDPILLRGILAHITVDDDVIRLAHGLSDPALRAAVLRHAQHLPDPTEALRDGLAHPDVRVRRAALQHLSERPDNRLLAAVRALLDDPDERDERYNPRPVSLLARDILRAAGEAV